MSTTIKKRREYSAHFSPEYNVFADLPPLIVWPAPARTAQSIVASKTDGKNSVPLACPPDSSRAPVQNTNTNVTSAVSPQTAASDISPQATATAVPAAPTIQCAAAAPAAPLREIGSVTSRGRGENLIGKAQSASEGYVGHAELEKRPILRPGELLETVPGLVISQHSGEGKANQYYLRGFNLDHGTDIAISVQGIPANMPSHAHGQGYADVNWVIPEIVDSINYRKGTYSADQGDFSTAGAVDMKFFDVLPKNIALVSGGPYGQARTLLAESSAIGKNTNLLYAVEYVHNDNTALIPDNYRKYNGMLRLTKQSGGARLGLTAQAYQAKWRSSDQIPLRAVQRGEIDRFGQIDPTDGGETHRYALSMDYDRDTSKSRTLANVYAMDYGLDLYSDFTYFLNDPVNMDQFAQKDRRFVLGLNSSHTWKSRANETTVGYQMRNDNITPAGLFATKARQILSTTRLDRINESSNSLYVQSMQRLSSRLRLTAGLRGDTFRFNVNDVRPENSGLVTASIISPKLALAYAPGPSTEFYADYGTGFHSNDARGVLQRVDPATGSAVDSATGQAIQGATPLVRAKGSEIGARIALNKRLRSTVALWQLDLASELVFVGDAGTTEAGRPSHRQGIEFANYWTPSTGLTYDFDYSTSSAKFTQFDAVGDLVPGSIQNVLTMGATLDRSRYFGSVRLRYFGPRPLIEDGSVYSKATTTVNLQAGIKPRNNTRVSFDVFNLFDAKASDIDYYYNSSIPSDPAYTKPGYAGACPVAECGAGVADTHFHPIGRRLLRLTFSKQF